MRERLAAATALALVGMYTTTGLASADDLSDSDKVMIGTAIVGGVLMLVLFLFYLLRHALGLDRIQPTGSLPEVHAAGEDVHADTTSADHGHEQTVVHAASASEHH